MYSDKRTERNNFLNVLGDFFVRRDIVWYKPNLKKIQRNWVFATNSNLLIPISLQPDGANLWYFKLRLFYLKVLIVWNIEGLRHWVTKIIEIRKSEFVAKTQLLCHTSKKRPDSLKHRFLKPENVEYFKTDCSNYAKTKPKNPGILFD